jgi:hypothetical protein
LDNVFESENPIIHVKTKVGFLELDINKTVLLYPTEDSVPVNELLEKQK